MLANIIINRLDFPPNITQIYEDVPATSKIYRRCSEDFPEKNSRKM